MPHRMGHRSLTAAKSHQTKKGEPNYLLAPRDGIKDVKFIGFKAIFSQKIQKIRACGALFLKNDYIKHF